MTRKRETRVVDIRPVDDRHQVVTVASAGGSRDYRRRPCEPTETDPAGCPWRVDQAGMFPPGAFRESACTDYDLADSMFGCHQSTRSAPLTCAGFLLRGAQHNFAVRKAVIDHRIDPGQVSDGGHELFDSYRAMAVANGVDPGDPVLIDCRGGEPR